MKIKVFGCTFCLVIVINCMLYEARTLYTVNPYDYTLSKRGAVERRGFLKSFCVRRCQVGRGGNLCRCNGFHFAGKRNGILPAFTENHGRVVEDDPEQIVYKILEENDKISIDPDKYSLKSGMVPQQDILREIEELLPEVMDEGLDKRPQRNGIGEMLEEYLRSDEI